MQVKCRECGCNEFSLLKDIWEEINYSKGTTRVVKDLECYKCKSVFRARVELEIKEVDLD